MRPLRSFRLRIALLVTSMSSIVLVAFAAWTWSIVSESNQDRVDDQIDRIAHRHIGRPGPPPWDRLAASLELLDEGDDEPASILLVKTPGGNIAHQSPNWPEGLAMDRFPDPPGPENGVENELPPFRDGGGPRRRQGRFRHPEEPAPQEAEFFTWNGEGQAWRLGVFQSPHFTLVLGMDLSAYTTRQRGIRNALLAAMAVGLVVVAGGGYLVAQRALRPVHTLGATAERVSAKGLQERISLYDEDSEFQRVINAFNVMMDRIEKGFHQATRFSADAAHELKTPLTILQGTLEEGVQSASPGSEEQARYGKLLEEVQRLKTIVRKLLLLSMADAGQLTLRPRPVDLSGMVEEVCEDIGVLAPDLTLKKRVQENIGVMGDADLLRQVVQNLTNNAIQHNTADGHIHVALSRDNDCVELRVANTGPGIPEPHRAKVFERFYRVDKARTREKGGAGLGLSLSREIARAHGGELTLEPAKAGTTAFTLTLPADGEAR